MVDFRDLSEHGCEQYARLILVALNQHRSEKNDQNKPIIFRICSKSARLVLVGFRNFKSTERQNDKPCLASVKLSNGTRGEVLGKAITIIRLRIPDRRPVQNRFETGRCKEHFAFQFEVLLTAGAERRFCVPFRSVPYSSPKINDGLRAPGSGSGSGSGSGLGARALGWAEFDFILLDKF